MDWDIPEGSEGSSSASDGGDSAVGDADAAALGMDTQPPEHYDPAADERDEAWAQRMRRARRSDALLSCPLCFTTLCIDCQQHERFDNQFRAMFVMNCKVKTGEQVALPARPGRRGKQRQQQPDAAAAAAAAGGGGSAEPPLGGEPTAASVTAGPAAAGAAAAGGAAAGGGTASTAGGAAAAAGGAAAEVMHPVCCASCDTEVGLRDMAAGVYHFFNVFASNS